MNGITWRALACIHSNLASGPITSFLMKGGSGLPRSPRLDTFITPTEAAVDSTKSNTDTAKNWAERVAQNG